MRLSSYLSSNMLSAAQTEQPRSLWRNIVPLVLRNRNISHDLISKDIMIPKMEHP